MNTKKLIKKVMSDTGYTLTKLANEISYITGQKTSVQNISNKLQRNTVKVCELEQWLNIMGYELDYKKTIIEDIASLLYPILYTHLEPEECSQVMSLLNNENIPNRSKMELRSKIVHNGVDNIRQYVAEFILEADSYIRINDFF